MTLVLLSLALARQLDIDLFGRDVYLNDIGAFVDAPARN
jgi:hypothetical protein